MSSPLQRVSFLNKIFPNNFETLLEDEILDKVNSRPRTFADEFLDESEIYKTMGKSKIYRRCREEKVIRDTVIRMSDQVLLKNLRKFFQRSYAITFVRSQLIFRNNRI